MPISREFNGGGYAPRRAAIHKLLTRAALFTRRKTATAGARACGREGAKAWTPTNIDLSLVLVALNALVPCDRIIRRRNPAEPRQTTQAICSAGKRPAESTEWRLSFMPL
jgi:hypothetical protein